MYNYVHLGQLLNTKSVKSGNTAAMDLGEVSYFSQKKKKNQIQNSKSCCKAEVKFQVHLEMQTFRNLGIL